MARSPIRVLRRGVGLARLRRQRPPGPEIASAVAAARADDWPPDEHARLEQIEVRRRELDGSSQELERTGDSKRPSETVGEVSRISSKSRSLARLLYALHRELRPQSTLELGTCVGISTAYLATAASLNGGGSVVSIDGSAARLAVAEETLRGLGLDDVDVRHGEFSAAMHNLAQEQRRFDWAFIDGNHREDPTVEYFEYFLRELAAPRALVIFDDIRWSEGMERAWARVQDSPRVELVVDLGPIGLVQVGQTAPSRVPRIAAPVA